ncbi:MAG: hypothetical protein GY720_20350 [bacterium]|nr:hypothetical protein [bacterium]
MTQHDDFEAAVEEMHAALVRRFPDPVDSFEDDLAKKLGLERDPEMSIKDWRRVRVRFIDAATPR